MAAILTLDLGSTQLKLMVLNENAEVLYLDSEKYPTYAEDGGFLEQKPEEWIEALQRGMRKLGQRMDARSIDAVSFSGHMSGVVLVDKQGEVLRPCVMLSDSRSQQECVELSETVGELVRRYTGNPVINAFSLPKLLWIKRHEPQLWRQTDVWLAPKDYLRYWITGEKATEYTDAYNSLCVDRISRTWCEAVIDATGLEKSKFPKMLSPDAQAGVVTAKAAQALGLRAGTPVYAGGADMACGALGMGLFNVGESALTLGTCATFLAPVQTADDRFFGQVTYHLHAVPGMFYALGSHFNGGLAVNWFSSLMNEKGELDYETVSALAAQAARVPAGSQGVMTIPFLVGSGSPYFNAADRLNILGASAATGRGQLFRSLLEGITMNLRQTKEIFDALSPERLKNVYLGGGGCRVAPWPQMIADIFDMEIQETVHADASTVGAAILGGMGAGIFTDARKTALDMLNVSRRLTPDAAQAGRYAELYPHYLNLYRLLSGRSNV